MQAGRVDTVPIRLPLAAKRLALTGWRAYRLWDRCDCIDLSAAFAYHTLQSIFPVLLIVLSTASGILGREDGLTEQIISWSAQFFPEASLPLIRTTLLKLQSARASAGWFGLGMLLLTSSNAYLTLQRGADRLWGDHSAIPSVASPIQQQQPWFAVRRFVLQRLKAFGFVGSVGLLLVIDQLTTNLRSMGTQTWRSMFDSHFSWLIQVFLPDPTVLNLVGSLLISVLVALLLLRVLPSGVTPWRPLLPAALLIGVVQLVLNLAVGRSLVSLGTRFQAYGVISGVLVLTLWVWLQGLIFYYGIAWSVVLGRRRSGGDPHLDSADRLAPFARG
ncbi:MAG: YihY/virulence factor BrkB family protein [Cyanobium sp.]|uniref:YihY/virulence factor BrkB family protein n=1 Tax=Synechococcus sp. CS-1333 TaxID=2848638 RepID=UPI000DBBB801|nr:YihY/virulence factor BrkB family protein [Synechococcus sp. CS-1333]MCT0211018.1 YihY/virulence factor BrkB family protein [Synechococcus sp. CS-1333]PZV21856.1 MAG: YihY/virulence factor BrkB family protein [Cyanobium sp.]